MNGNLFAGLPDAALADEVFETLGACGNVRIERIVSTGQCSAPGFWYDQAQDEWVALLRGTATLRFADEAQGRDLLPGDWLFIAAHRRHRIERSDAGEPSVWLAVHVGRPVSPAPGPATLAADDAGSG